MNVIRNLAKYLVGDTTKTQLIEIPSGQLYVVRPKSVKGYSELIFKDATASIRRTGQDYQFQLVISKSAALASPTGDDEDEESALNALLSDGDEKTFLLDEALRFRSEARSSGRTFAWRDLSGEVDDVYEFICSKDLAATDFEMFEAVASKCQFERKYRKTSDEATSKDLDEFNFSSPIPKATPITSPALKESAGHGLSKAANTSKARNSAPVKAEESGGVALPKSKAAPATEVRTLISASAELHIFDPPSGNFVLQDSEAIATVTERGPWQYWLQIDGKSRQWVGQEIVEELNPVFSFEYLSFIFNHFSEDGNAYSWLLRFPSDKALTAFQERIMQALWEKLNKIRWEKTKEDDRQYVLDAFQDLNMRDEDEPAEEQASPVATKDRDPEDEDYDSDESAYGGHKDPEDGNVNSQLAVGYAQDRSFVVRGSKIGVFTHTPSNNLKFSTNISKVQTPKGRLFSPKKLMLHSEDRDLILKDEANPNSLYRMDLEVGKIVDEYKIHEDIGVENFAPEKKFAQMTGEQTFLGISKNALYRIDPRLAGNKLVEAQLKQYASKNEFSAAATTEKGYIAVASDKGDIRMFDRLGVNAKTHIPALGEAIIGLDVSADGRWVLATCRTYLLLIDAMQTNDKNAGKLGFERSFPANSKPQPRRLGLQPSHVAQFQHEMRGSPLKFTVAHFNTGLDEKETSIVTSTGPFIITWSLKKVLDGRKDPYTIKRYGDEVVADNFKFGSDKNVIVALPNQVDMAAKQSFKKPTRESIMSPPKTPRRTTALSRNEVVNSPY